MIWIVRKAEKQLLNERLFFMKTFLLIFVFVSFPVFGDIVFDAKNLEISLGKNPDDMEVRLLLASYYLKSGDLKAANRHINVALKQDASNAVAQNLKKEWEEIRSDKKLLSSLKITDINDTQYVNEQIKSLYVGGRSEILDRLFTILGKNRVKLTEDGLIARVALLVGQAHYAKAKKLLDEAPSKSSGDYQKLRSIICLNINDLNCAVPLLQKLYSSSHDSDIGFALTEALMRQGRVIDAKKVVKEIKSDFKKNKYFSAVEKEINRQLVSRSDNAKKEFQKAQSDGSVKRYATSLINNENRKKAYEVLHSFLDGNPGSDNIRIFLSRQYALEHKYAPAIELLNSLVTKTQKTQILVAQYVVWSGGRTEKSKNILLEVLEANESSRISRLKIRESSRAATLLLSKIYLRERKKTEALKHLNPLIKEYPGDIEVEELYLLAKEKYKVLIERLENNLKHKKKSQTILQLARVHLLAGDKKKSLEYFERYHKLNPSDARVEKDMGLLYLTQKKYASGFKLLKRSAYRDGAEEELLNLAKNYYWNGYSLQALEVIAKIQKRYPKSRALIKLTSDIYKAPLNARDPNLIKAGKAYKNKDYKGGIPLYEKYLKQYPSDSFTRNRYAYALGKVGSYAAAAEEFSTLLKKDPANLYLRFHYAYNLEKTGNIESAKKIYHSIIEETRRLYKEGVPSKMDVGFDTDKIYTLAIARLEFIEKDKDTVVNGLYLSGGVKKNLGAEREVLSSAIVKIDDNIDKDSKSSLVKQDILYNTRKDSIQADAEYVYTTDSEGVEFSKPGIAFRNESWPNVLGFNYDAFHFSDSICEKASGSSAKIIGRINKSTRLSLGGGVRIDDLNKHLQYFPFLTAKLNFDKSYLDLVYYKRPLFHDKLSCAPLKNNTIKSGIEVSGSVDFNKTSSLLYSVDAGFISDDNIEVIPQFKYTFYKNSFKNNYVPVDYEMSVEGYYLWNKLQVKEYYSPASFDSTSGGLLLAAHLSDSISLVSDTALGYSVDSSNLLFRIGVSGEYSVRENTYARVGCERSNIGNGNAGDQDYEQDNCSAMLEVQWK